MKHSKKLILIGILFLTIGFALVSTVLYVNGNVSIVEGDFDVIFTKAILDNVDVSDDVISNNKKNIDYTGNTLKHGGDITKLDFEVENTTRNYDASIEINCSINEKVLSNGSYVDTAENLKDLYELNTNIPATVFANSKANGFIEVKLKKSTDKDIKINVVCELVGNGIPIDNDKVIINTTNNEDEITDDSIDEDTTILTMKEIAHDIYYSDENLYKNGKNIRNSTFCFTYKKAEEKGVYYCPQENSKKKECFKTTEVNTCSYLTAKDILGVTNLSYQTKLYNFSDKGNGNWHVLTYGQTVGQETPYEGGYYYADDNLNVHDWYDKEETSFSSLGTLCKRATKLHTEICDGTCKRAGYTYYEDITYGSLGTAGTLTAGDAFDCDVNGNGVIDEDADGNSTERFYYVSPLYTGGSSGNETWDDNTAVLIYYNNTSAGIPDNMTTYNYESNSYSGPVTLVQQLPTTTQWSKLRGTTRNILNEIGGNTVKIGSDTYPLPGNGKDSFDYSNYAARFLTFQEAQRACGSGTTHVEGYLDNCKYLIENTYFSNSKYVYGGYWIETPKSSGSSYMYVYLIHGQLRGLYSTEIGSTGAGGVRPVIDVPISNIEY